MCVCVNVFVCVLVQTKPRAFAITLLTRVRARAPVRPKVIGVNKKKYVYLICELHAQTHNPTIAQGYARMPMVFRLRQVCVCT